MDIIPAGAELGAPLLTINKPTLRESIDKLRELKRFLHPEQATYIDVVLEELGKHEYVPPTLTVNP